MKQFFSDKRRPGWLVWILFGLFLLVGAAFRFQALDWDQGQSFHPDERAIIQAVGALNTVVDYGDPKNLFNPRHPVGFPYNGLGFFIPNGADIRPATDQETQLYENAKRSGTSYTLPPNVVLPDQSPPDKAINFWNAAYSPLNPHFFAYGTFPMYAIKFGGFFMSAVTGQDWNEWTKLTQIGRFLSVLWSLGTLILVFLLGRRIFGPIMGRGRGDAIGLTAMAFMAVAVLDIQLAHYLAFDVPLTFFITLAIYAAIGQMRTGTRWSALRTGLAIGLALACKISAAPVVLVGVIAALLYGLYGSARHSGEIIGLPQTTPLPNETTRYPNAALGRRLLGGTVVNLLIMGGAALVIWFVAMPYAFLDFANWSSRVIEETGMSRGINDFPYTRQYVGSTPFLYQISNLVQWGLGWPLGLLALVGFGFGLWRLFGRRYKAELLVFSWLLPYILITFTGEVKFNRYLLPILPLLMVLAARFIVEKALPSVVKIVSSKTTGSTEQEEEAEAVPVSAGTARPRRLRPRTWVMGGLGGLAFVWALVWALSFSTIYRQEHTMNQATRWMYANIPDGASFITEQWDESLPTGIKGINTGGKAWMRIDPAMDLYGDAPNEQKIDYFINQFKQTDYIIITSNRLYATMPKLPWRYPIQIRYYELLFSGKLGYQQVATFTDYPTIPLLNLPVIDDGADESFTVYDHPKVMIFKKVAQYSDDQYKGLFANAAKAPWIPQRYAKPADLPEVNVKQGDGALESTTAGQARYYDIKDGKRVDNAKSLLLDKPVDQLPVIDDIGWFKLANDNQWFAVILWFVLAQVLGLLGLPVMLRVCRRLPDRAYILAKPVGGLVVALVIWLLVWTRQVMNTVSTAYIALALVAVASAWLFWRNHSEVLGWIKDHRKLILIEEAIFLVAYLVWIWVRLGNPDLWHPYYGGEKPMEFTHLNGILRSAYFPPYDPWFSDGYINYYYYGQYLVATWIKLTGIEPGIAFNLALPLLYGFVCAGGFSLVYNLATNYKQRQPQREDPPDTTIGGPVVAGFFGVFIFAIAGNFDGFIQILQRFQPIVDLANKLNLYPEGAEVVTKFDYFRSTRIIDGTNISEFPFFSFLYGDLHAHLINLPYTLVALALALNLVSANWIGYDESGRNIIQKVALRLHRLFDGTFLLPLLLAALIGFLAATNIWDLPTYLGITGIALFLGLFRRPAVPVNSEAEAEKLRPRFMPLDLLLNLVVTGVVTGGILVLGYALYWNFFSHFQALYGQIAQTRTRSPLLYWLVIFIFPLFILLTYLVWSFAQWIKPGQGARPGDLPPRPTPRYEDEDELDEPDDLPLESAPTLQPRPGFKMQLRPELALSYAGADGGFNEGLGGGSPTPPEPLRPVSRFNNFSLPWLGLVGVGLLGFVIVGLVSQQWLVMALGIILTFAAIFLVLAKSFDPDPAQAAEARQPQNLFLRLLIAVSFAIVAGVEFFYLVDDLSGSDSLHRMNTIFKFYYQVWTMLTLGAAFALYVLWQRWIFPTVSSLNLPRMSFGGLAGRVAWLVVLSFLVGSVAVYPVLATPDKWSERASTPLPPPTLDGRAYFDTLRVVGGMPAMPPGKYFDMTYEAQSLHEFYDNIKGTPVVMQMSIWPYRGNGSWISINTGLPTVLGWDHHETQQRYPEEVIRRSETAGVVGCVREFYNTPDITHALQILNHYHVTYVHLGTIERDGDTQGHSAYVNGPDENCLTSDMYNGGNDYEPLMSDEGYDKFDKMVKLGLLEIAYQNPGVTVYKLTAKGEAGVVEGDPNSLPSTAGTASDPKLNRLLQAVNANPSDAQARYDLGQFYFQRRQYDKAAEQLKMVTQLQPKEINPYHVLGDIYAAMGDNERALDAWKQPTIFAPTNPAANNKYGIGLLGNGKAEEAVTYFKKAVQANAHFEEAYFHMGEAYELLNRRDDAILAYEQTAAVATDRNSFWVKRATEQVAKLSGKKP